MFRHEMFRLRSRRLLYLLLGLMLLINGILYVRYYSEQTGNSIYTVEDYRELWSRIEEVPQAEREARYEKLRTQQQVLLQYFMGMTPNALSAMYDPDNSGWVMELLEAYNRTPEEVLITGDVFRDQELFRSVKGELEGVLEYDEFREDMLKRGQMLLSGTILTLREDGYNARNIRKTIEDYSSASIPEIRGVYNNSRGVESLAFSVTNVCCIILIMFAVAELFVYEKEQGLEALARTNKRAMLPRLHGKLIALVVFAIFVSLLFSAENVFLAESLYGIGDWGRAIQTVSAYTTSVNVLTVGQYIVVSALLRGCAMIVVALVAAMCTVWAKDVKLAFCIAGFVLGIEYALFVTIGSTSYLSNLHFINLMGLVQPDEWLITYRNVNLFGMPVSYSTVVLCTALAAAALAYVILARHYCRAYTEKTRSGGKRVHGARRKKQAIRRHSVRLWLQEAYRIGIAQHVLVNFLAVALIGAWWIHSGYEEPREDIQERYYQEYVARMEGPITAETHEFIEQETSRFAELEQELAEIQQRALEAASEEERNKLLSAEMIVQNQLAPKDAFERFCTYVEYLRTTEEGYVVDERPYEQLYLNVGAETAQTLVAVVGMLLMIPMIFYQDRDTMLVGIIGSTKKSRQLLFLRLGYGAFLSVSIAVIPFVSWYAAVQEAFGKITSQGHFPATSVQGLAGFYGVSLGAYLAITVVLRIVGALVVMLLLCGVAHMARTSTILWLSVSMLFLMPLLIDFLYPSLAEMWLHMAPLLGSPCLAYASTGKRVVIAAVCIGGVGASAFVIRRKYSRL